MLTIKNIKLKNIAFLILSVFLAVTVFYNLENSVELNGRAIVLMLTLDLDENNDYTACAQVFSGEGSKGELDASVPNCQVFSGSGKTIDSAISNLSASLGMKVFYGQLRMLVASFEVANQKMPEIFGFLAKESEISKDVLIAVSKNASEVANARLVGGITPANLLEDMLNNSIKNGFVLTSSFLSVVKAQKSNFDASFSLPIINVSKDEQKDIVSVGDLYVFRDNAFYKTISSSDAVNLSVIKGSLNSTVVDYTLNQSYSAHLNDNLLVDNPSYSLTSLSSSNSIIRSNSTDSVYNCTVNGFCQKASHISNNTVYSDLTQKLNSTFYSVVIDDKIDLLGLKASLSVDDITSSLDELSFKLHTNLNFL